jgi:hypothetical protein
MTCGSRIIRSQNIVRREKAYIHSKTYPAVLESYSLLHIMKLDNSACNSTDSIDSAGSCNAKVQCSHGKIHFEEILGIKIELHNFGSIKLARSGADRERHISDRCIVMQKL